MTIAVILAIALCFSAPHAVASDPRHPDDVDSSRQLVPSRSSDVTAGAEVDEDELWLIERRRLALEAEMGEESGPSGFGGLAMSTEDLDAMPKLIGDIGVLPSHPSFPLDNLPTKARIDLGHRLFFDRRLSRDGSLSCASCHDPSKGWADNLPRAVGFKGRELGRHSPTVINAAYNTFQFWDGRVTSLEKQAIGPIMDPNEMNMGSAEHVLEVVGQAAEYEGAFEQAYGSGLSMENIGKAIAAFERTVVTGPSAFDRYVLGDKFALTEKEKRGLILFMTTASCTACHSGANFTDNKFHALGVYQKGPLVVDRGRFEISGEPQDRHAFKTPGLRNVEQTAPYMHDGSLATLEQVVEFYNKGGEENRNRSKLIKPLNLSESQKDDLVTFLRSLTGPLPDIQIPVGEHFGT